MPEKQEGFIRNEGGFVLIVVLWGLGVLLVLTANFATTTRSYTKVTANQIANARAQAHADAGVHLALASLLIARTGVEPDGLRVPLDGTPLTCRIGSDAVLAISIEDESGKVDLNAAPAELLSALFAGFGADASRAEALTQALLDFRDGDSTKRPNGAELDDYIAAGLMVAPRNAPLLAAEELEQVFGMDTDLYTVLHPYVTVHSRHSGIDPSVTPLPLLAALTGVQPPSSTTDNLDSQRQAYQLPRASITPSDGSAFTIRVEVHRPQGGLFIREAIVEVPRSRTPPYRYVAWNQGERRPGTSAEIPEPRSDCIAE